jgi:hypothetical protein
MDYYSWWLIDYRHDIINEYEMKWHLLGLRPTPRWFWDSEVDNRPFL